MQNQLMYHPDDGEVVQEDRDEEAPEAVIDEASPEQEEMDS